MYFRLPFYYVLAESARCLALLGLLFVFRFVAIRLLDHLLAILLFPFILAGFLLVLVRDATHLVWCCSLACLCALLLDALLVLLRFQRAFQHDWWRDR